MRICRGEYGTDLGAKEKSTVINLVVDQFYAKRVASDNEALPADIPDSQAKHAIQMIENIRPPLLVPMHDYLCVTGRAERMSKRLQLVLQLQEVVYFTVKDYPDGLFLIRHRLMTTREIYN